MEDYKEKYEQALEKAKKELNACGSQDCDAAKQIFRLFPELKESEGEKIRREIIEFINSFKVATLNTSKVRRFESWITWIEKQKEIFYTVEIDNEDEKIRKAIINYFQCQSRDEPCRKHIHDKWITWLEKQKDINSKEYVFRPLAGCDIESAATQAVEQQKLGNKIVLAFNGAYIPVKEKNADDIVKEYYYWLEKQGELTQSVTKTSEQVPSLLDLKLMDCPLSVKTTNGVKVAINKPAKDVTLGDIIKCNKAELLALRNFGKVSLKELEDFLADYGLKLEGD